MHIVLVGNPNSGKTTMYNALTGMNEKVGNWAGVTIDKREAYIKKTYTNEDILLTDLPGAYSLSPYTSEESITSSYVLNANPDVIIAIVDSENLSRSLFFVTQLLELKIPMVVALNKNDISVAKDTKIDDLKLASMLGCEVVKTSALEKKGLKELVEKAISLKGHTQIVKYHGEVVDTNDVKAVEEADRKRFAYVDKIVKEIEIKKVKAQEFNSQDKLDKILTHPILGLIIFAFVMFMVFHISQSEGPLGLGKMLEGVLSGLIDSFSEYVSSLLGDTNPLLKALLVDGIIGGVGAVLGFLPLVMVMYFLIALLEDCGYMARATVVLDPIFKRVGLSGKSVIPFVIGTGCAIPGIMACRTIKNDRERKTTAMLTPFMPCGAKLPVISLFAGAFFEDASWVGTMMYFVGILLILLGALLVKAITGYKYKKSYFIIELPEYKVPSLKLAFNSMIERGKAYIVKAGTIILVCNTLVQIMQTFTWNLTPTEVASESILATLATPVAYLLIPIVGVCSWQLAAAAVTGFIAKENVVGTLAVCFVGLHNLIDVEELELVAGKGNDVANVLAITKVAALAYLMFNLYTPPCFAALGAMRAEIEDRKWYFGGIALQFATGYSVAFWVYQIGTLITTGSLGAMFIEGFIVEIAIVITITTLIIKNNQKELAHE